MANKALYILLALLATATLLAGCHPVARHKFKTALLDGYPSMPAPDEYFAYYADQLAQLQAAEEEGAEAADDEQNERSVHMPYGEKACKDCHDKSKTIGLIRPKEKLCSMCHEDFIQGKVVHGPVAVGACLACHLPHSSQYPLLLKASVNTICDSCHTEKRLAAPMHEKVSERGMICVDCHDPHFSNTRYFL